MATIRASEPSIPLPEDYLRAILNQVQDLAELKLILHAVVTAAGRDVPALTLDELTHPDVLRMVVGLDAPEPGDVRLRRVVDRAVANGHLLRVRVGAEVFLLPATADSRELLDRLRAGEVEATEALAADSDAEIAIYRPNIFAVYERHIGPLTPLVAERMRDAERTYPRAWIESAFLAAVHYNRRSWPYIEAILARWERTGGPDEARG